MNGIVERRYNELFSNLKSKFSDFAFSIILPVTFGQVNGLKNAVFGRKYSFSKARWVDPINVGQITG